MCHEPKLIARDAASLQRDLRTLAGVLQDESRTEPLRGENLVKKKVGSGRSRPGTWVTDRTGYMGDAEQDLPSVRQARIDR
jgi:hypothetical protein